MKDSLSTGSNALAILQWAPVPGGIGTRIQDRKSLEDL